MKAPESLCSGASRFRETGKTKKIFRPYARLAPRKGSGLGLADEKKVSKTGGVSERRATKEDAIRVLER